MTLMSYPGTSPPPHLPAFLPDSQKLMRLQAEPPARMSQAILKCSRGVGLPFRSVHRLQIEVLELEGLVSARLGPALGKHQLELVTAGDHQGGICLRADAHPVQAGRNRLRPI